MICSHIKSMLSLILFSDVILRILLSPIKFSIIREKAYALNYLTVQRYGKPISIAHRLSRELGTKRLFSSIDKLIIRNIFFSNLRFSIKIKEAGLHKQFLYGGSLLARIPSKMFIVNVIIRYNKRIALEEGDFTIEMFANGTLVHFLTFSFADGLDFFLDEGEIILVGGNQGCEPSKQSFRRQVVRDCFDISPEEIVFLCLIGFARRLKIRKIVCVGVNTHVKAINKPLPDIDPSMLEIYDGFWRSQSAEEKDGFYLIDPHLDPVGNSIPRGGHKKRKLQKRHIKRRVVEEVTCP